MKNNKIILVFTFLISNLVYSQEIKLLDIIHKEELKYNVFYHKKTIKGSEIIPDKNISIITDNPRKKFDIFVKKNEKCYPINENDIIVSMDFIIPSELLIGGKTLKNENLDISQTFIKKKKSYILYETQLKKVPISILEMTKNYYNTHSINLKICGNSKDKIILYKIDTFQE